MLPTERRIAIVDQIRRRPMVRADELALRFSVSVETVRRDLRVLQRDGVLDRVYGGATPAPPPSTEAAFAPPPPRTRRPPRGRGGEEGGAPPPLCPSS